MADFFSSLAQGLRGAGSVLNPHVQAQIADEEKQRMAVIEGRKNLMMQQLIRASESGAMNPAAASQALGQMGVNLPDGAIGPNIETQQKASALKREQLKAMYLQSPEAQEFISKQDDIGLMRDMGRRGLLTASEVYAGLKEARESNKPVSFGNGMGYQPDGKGGGSMLGSRAPQAPHTVTQEYTDTDGTKKSRVLQYDPQTNGWVPAKLYENTQAPGPQVPQVPPQAGPQVTSNIVPSGGQTPQDVMRIIQALPDDNPDKAPMLNAYRAQLAQGPQAPQGAPIFKPTTVAKPPTGFRFSADGKSLEAIPGGPADQGPMNPADMASAAASVATGMPLTQVVPGYGRQVAGRREQVRVEAINQIKAQNPGMTDTQAGQEYANRTIDYVAGKRSVGQLNTMLGATRQAVDQLDFNVKKVTEEMAKLKSSDLSPIFNAIIRQEEKWTGDPAYSSLYYYMSAAAMESARILQGGQASVAQLHAGAAAEAKKWADANFTTPKQWSEGVAPAMVAEGRERLKTYERAISSQRLGAKPAASGAPISASSVLDAADAILNKK